MKLYLITHAHTQVDPTQDAVQWQLSASGAQQAQTLAEQPWWAAVDRIVISSEPKTRLTVAPVLAQRALPVLIDARFDELKRPGWTDEYAEQVRQAFANPDQPSGAWEAAAHAQARFLAAIADLCLAYPTATLALVGHGLTFSLYRAYLRGEARVNLADWRTLSFAAVALVAPSARQLVQDFQPVAGHMARG